MRNFDTSKKYQVTLTFLLDEEITPQLFAHKIARACGDGGALRPGEAILARAKDLAKRSKLAWVVIDETLSVPSFGCELQSTLKKTGQRKKTRQRKTSRRKPR